MWAPGSSPRSHGNGGKIPTSIRSYRAHHARGAVDMDILRAWWLPVVTGVVLGSLIARYAPERLSKIVFVMVAYSAAAP